MGECRAPGGKMSEVITLLVSALGKWLDKIISSKDVKDNCFHLGYVDLKCQDVE